MSSGDLFAELEIMHTRPAVATRRIALGHLVLPVQPAPGAGGLLLGAVAARFIGGVDPDLRLDLLRLVDEVERGVRVVQPRLRHRYQTDRHGLAVSRHSLRGSDEQVEMNFESKGSDLVQVLAAVYAIERLDDDVRPAVAEVVRRGMRWNGPIGPPLIAFLAGADSDSLASLTDPRGWALALLGFDAATQPSAQQITSAYRERMRLVHPDLGGQVELAGHAISELRRARRILGS